VGIDLAALCAAGGVAVSGEQDAFCMGRWMMGFFDLGVNDGNRFVAVLMTHAAKTVESIRDLEESLDKVNDGTVHRLHALADDSGELRRVLVDELLRTFITPLDREDIFNLAHGYEGMVACALTTLEEMHILNVNADENIRRIVALVSEQAQELQPAIERLAKNPREATDHAHEVGHKERQVQRLYRAATKELFAHPLTVQDLSALFIGRLISNMSHHADAAANVFGMVVMKLS
jgi:uncharacterized protein Yka (UPF0111/DUF47 family)